MTVVLQRFSQLAAAEVAIEQKCARRQLRLRMQAWQQSLERARRARAIQEKRRQQFRELAQELDVSSKKGLAQDLGAPPDMSVLDITDTGEPDIMRKKAAEIPADVSSITSANGVISGKADLSYALRIAVLERRHPFLPDMRYSRKNILNLWLT